MIDREFTKRIRLLNGRHETIKTKFQLEADRLVEHVVLETFDRPAHAPCEPPRKGPSAT